MTPAQVVAMLPPPERKSKASTHGRAKHGSSSDLLQLARMPRA